MTSPDGLGVQDPVSQRSRISRRERNMSAIARCYVVKGEQGWGIWQMTDEALTRRTKEDPTIPDRLDSQLFGTWEEAEKRRDELNSSQLCA